LRRQRSRTDVAGAAKDLSDVEIVVNNAGVGSAATALGATLDDARAELEVSSSA
jgi:NADP-dependent 3-hydroxy acid dehydrogenase YdfG